MHIPLGRKAKIVLSFLAGQGGAQALNLACGFLIVRWLNVSSYGQYSLTYGLQSLVNMLLDLGFSTTIVALVGNNTGDPRIVGGYIRAGRSLRSKLMIVAAPVASLAYFIMTSHLGWPFAARCLLCLSLLTSIQFSGLQAYYSAPLFIHRRLGIYYRAQVASALFRLLGAIIIYQTGLLDAIAAAWLNTAGIALTGILLKRATVNLISEPSVAEPGRIREMMFYAAPNLPSFIFYALQGQIAVFLMAAFGQTNGIAQTAALSRLSQLFVLLGSFNSVVLEPWFARATIQQMKRRLMLGAVFIAGLSGILIGTAAAQPILYLWVLGPKYANLHVELVWSVTAGCVAYASGVIWTAVSARRLIYWKFSILTVSLTLCSQALFLKFANVSTTLRATQFSFVSGLPALLIVILNICYGLKVGPRTLGNQRSRLALQTEGVAA